MDQADRPDESGAEVPSPPLEGTRRGILAVLLAVLVLDLVGIGWGLPHTLAPHPDDVAKPTMHAMQSAFLEQTKYGKVHMLTLAAAYSPYLGYLWATGELSLASADYSGADLDDLQDPAASISNLLLIARLAEVALHLGAAYLLYRVTLRWVRRPSSALLGAALFASTPFIAFFARTSTIDVPMLFWFAAALLGALRFRERSTRRRLIIFCVLAVLAVCTKEQIGFALLPVCAWVTLVALRNRSAPVGERWLGLIIGGVLGAFVYALLNDLLWNPALYVERMEWWQEELAGYRASIAGEPGFARLAREGTVYFLGVAGPGFSLLIVWLGLRALVKRDVTGILLFGLLLLYPVLLLKAIGFVLPRYLFPMVMIGAMLVARQWDQLRTQLARRSPVRRVAAGLLGLTLLVSVVQSGLVAYECVVEPRSPATRWLMDNVERGHEVEYYQKVNSLPGVEAARLVPALSRTMEREDFLARRPPLVCVVDNERWHQTPEEIAFVEWLLSGPPGYELVRFGRRGPDDERLWLPHGLDGRIRPEIAILRRVDE